ncbi:MAG: IS110 family transposase [Phycisphaerae bacterium]|nr:IS110 family transposase [Phycisphaerae bacterium]
MEQNSTGSVFVGIDYHQKAVQVCVLDDGGRVLLNRSLANDRATIETAVGSVGRPRRVALEACGGSANLAQELVDESGWSVELAHPGYVARMKGSPDKTDFSDARLLADLTRVGYLPRVWLAPPYLRELRLLVRYRQQQVDRRRAIKLRVSALLREHRVRPPEAIRPWTKMWQAWLTEEVMGQLPESSGWILGRHLWGLESVSREIAAAVKRLRQFTKNDGVVERLLAEPCVGEVTAWVLRAEVGRFDRFNSPKALSRFCGLSPRNASSGQRQADAGLIKAGSSLLRATLIELAHRLSRSEPHWRGLKQRLCGAGKSGSVATAAVANRWVRQLWHRMQECSAVE